MAIGSIQPVSELMQNCITRVQNVLQLADGPHCLFSRIRLFIGATLVEDLDSYDRNHAQQLDAK